MSKENLTYVTSSRIRKAALSHEIKLTERFLSADYDVEMRSL